MFDVPEAAERLVDAPETRPPSSASPPRPERRLVMKYPVGVPEAQAEASLRVRGLVHNAGLIEDFSGCQFGAVEDLTPTVAALEASVVAVQRGELGDAEALLMAQAATLNAIFAALRYGGLPEP